MIYPMDLTGKHIIVAGASSGIGAETARQITRLGGKVSLLARREDKLQEVINSLEEQRGEYYVCDFADTESISEVIEQIYQEQGSFDGAVYSVGEAADRSLKMMKPNKLHKTVSVNYLGYVEFVRCISQEKYRSANMSIVGISSVASKVSDKGMVAYSSTKEGMNGAMRAIAQEFAGNNIRINNILPGWVKTAMYDETIVIHGADNIHNRISETQYLGGGLLKTIDIANAVCFLLSDAAKGISGTEMVVAGGCLS